MRGGFTRTLSLSMFILAGCAPLQPGSTTTEAASSVLPASPTADVQPGNETTAVDVPSSTTAESPVEEPSSPPPFEPRDVTINVSGDLLWHNTLFTSAEIDARQQGEEGMDFEPQLASLTPFVERADIAVCHAEVPLAPEGGPYTGYPMFGAPHETVTAIDEIGWDACTTASNHTMDKGWDGLVRTIDVLEEAGIVPIGTHRTEEEAETPRIVTTDDGVKVGFVSQTYGLNGLPKAEGKDWSVSLIDADAAIADAKAAKEAGADIVGVHMHAGDEYVHEPNAQQLEFAEAVTASEYVDFVFGQHAHVVQPIDKVNGKWVLYGSGNLIAQSGPAKPYTYDGYVAEVTFIEQEDGTFVGDSVEWAPTFITKHSAGAPARALLIPDAIEQGIGDADAMEKSAERTRKIVAGREPAGLTELS